LIKKSLLKTTQIIHKEGLPMHKTCSYCHDIYTPRVQVKNPKACNKSECQKHRQRDNERDWHQKNKNLYDQKYHQIKRKIRKENFDTIINLVIDALLIGLRFKGKNIKDNLQKLTLFFSSLGIRQINKLCPGLSP